MPAVGIDFDGPIHLYSRGWQGGEIYDDPTPGAFDIIRELLEMNVSVFVFTSREDLFDVANWLIEKSGDLFFEIDGIRSEYKFWDQTGRILITNRKYPAVAYIDDRAIRFFNWQQAMNHLHTFEGI